MKKFFQMISVNIFIIILLTSCGEDNTNKPSSLSNMQEVPYETSTSKEDDKNTERETGKKEENVKEKPDGNITQEPKEEEQIIKATIDTQTGYSDNQCQISVIGLKSYKKIESKLYKDKASKNKKFLVLFLEIINKKNDKDYINVNYLSAKVDGKEVKNTVLFNEPEGFKTIFQNIEPQNTLRGFIVWEVPDNWKKIKIIYNGWKDSNNLSLNCTFTPKDYFDPPQYN
ncbi:MAG: DUF5067 domain-containing protein [Lachnospiraceae bacterium]|nr:DUF5067 domain-containing protein [Lachnospiraceae bacterium]